MKQNIILLIISTILIGALVYLNTDLNTTDNIKSTGSMNVMVIGDVGTGEDAQKEVADKMNEIAQEKDSKMILSLGDNFYGMGVSGLDDPGWETKYAEIYPQQSYLKDLPWYGTIGNHDFYGEGLFTQFEYKKNNWQIEDFFWTHTAEIDNKKIAFIHVDTNFLAYGPEGTFTDLMKQYFEELEWKNDEDVLALAEEQLYQYRDYDWIIAMGHHHIGHSCYPIRSTGKLYTLLQKYNVDMYLNGHSHTLAYDISDEMGMIVSGAGGKNRIDECAISNPMWSKGYVYGFVNIDIQDDLVDVTAYYIDKNFKKGWKEHSLPSVKRRNKN